MISEHSGRDVEQVSKDIERDKILTAAQAVEYGLIDSVLDSRKAVPALAGNCLTYPASPSSSGGRGGVRFRSCTPGARECARRHDQHGARRGSPVARIGDGGDLLKCSFCGKSQKQVKKLIAGPGVYICDECIDLCNEIIEEELNEGSDVGLEELPKPRRSSTSSTPT